MDSVSSGQAIIISHRHSPMHTYKSVQEIRRSACHTGMLHSFCYCNIKLSTCTCVGIHVEITTEEGSQTIGGAASTTSSTGDMEEDDEQIPTLSSEQLARRPSFKSVICLYTHQNRISYVHRFFQHANLIVHTHVHGLN